MVKLGRTKRAIAIIAASITLAATCAIASAPIASAAQLDGGCRGGGNNDNNEWPTGSWASEPGGVVLLPCLDDDGSGYVRPFWYFNGGNLGIFPCAQLIKIGTGQVKDFGCEPGWVAASSGYNPNSGYQAWGNGVIYRPGSGEFVLQEGFWATINGVYSYYGAAQSWPIQF
jgi:uncharacterized membrane protein